MPETQAIEQRETTRSSIRRGPAFRRFLLVYVVLLLLVLVALAVPLINLNRFQRRIVTSLSESLGRPVHLDRISLTLLPVPGLTLENLVISEDAAFGAEPFVRASAVRATLRMSSLWRRHVEFTRISFTDPSINLVNLHGRWNLEGILLQAARIDAAPTAQSTSSAAPRFPYIEVSNARLNLKLAQEKTPFSLTEADCALWLADPGQWHLRLDGRPMRTDTSVSQTGSLQMEGTLGRASRLSDVPLDLRATWRAVPLGEATRLLLGRDAGLRGTMTLTANSRGTIGTGTVDALLHLSDLRRADFVPARTLSVDAECSAAQSSSFHAFAEIRCSWPPALNSSQKTLALTAAIPDIRQPSSLSAQAGTPGIPAATLLDWARIASPRISPEVQATGTLTGTALLEQSPFGSTWNGQFLWNDATLAISSLADAPIFAGTLALRSVSPGTGNPRPQFVLAPVPLALGGRDAATFDAHFDTSGYTLHLAGTASPAKLLAFGVAIPQLGDGLPDALTLPSFDEASKPVPFDLTSNRTWGGDRTWHRSEAAPTHPARRASAIARLSPIP